MAANQFDPFRRHREEKGEAPETRPRRTGTPPMLLNWLRNRWPRTTVAVRDIYRHGPCPIRGDLKIVLDLAEELVAQGALTPIQSWRYDRKEWQIVGKKGGNAGLSQQLSELS